MCSRTHSLAILVPSCPEQATTESLISSIFLFSAIRTTPSSSIVARSNFGSAPGAAAPTSSANEGEDCSIESCPGRPVESRKLQSRRHLRTTSQHISPWRAVTRLGSESGICAISSTASVAITRSCASVSPHPLRIRKTLRSRMRADCDMPSPSRIFEFMSPPTLNFAFGVAAILACDSKVFASLTAPFLTRY